MVIMGRHAFVDESEPRVPAGTYLLAAAMVDGADLENVRYAVSALRLRGQRKLHWRNEGESRRKEITAALARLPMIHLVVVKTDAAASSERRRRLALGRLLAELETAAVDDVCLESREHRQNQGDIVIANALRRQRVVSTSMRLTHLPGPVEPLLWVPDAVAGVVGAALADDPGHLDLFPNIEIVEA